MKKRFLIFIYLLSLAYGASTQNNLPKIYDFVEVLPEYPGGTEALSEAIATHLIYPKDSCAVYNGKVYVKFVVDTLGNTEQVKVVKSLCASMDSAALNAVENLSGWQPGKQNGKKVNVWYTLPVKFESGDGSASQKNESAKQSKANFPGGQEAFIKYINSELKYPPLAKKSGISGTVYLVFKVNEDGSISNVHVGQGIGAGCDEEAIRLLENMPKWEPAFSNGKPVSSYVSVGIDFAL